LTLTLAPTSDFQLAARRLTEAVNSVYEQYRESIERQYENLQKSLDIQVSAPRPETRLRFTESGLEFWVHYPVDMNGSAITDDRVLKALHDAIASEPKLTLAPSGSPKFQSAA
ncbi:MAG: hypothetical protein ABSB35_31365, partial [Bryobacteraceae bacterium]